MDEMLSTVSSAKDLGSRQFAKHAYPFPIPKNRDLGKFMHDVSDTESKARFISSGKKKSQSGKEGRCYGEMKNKHQNITKLLHHNYLSQYADYAKDK